uniref:Uncharacterized protein n=1 Tax=Cacopsylla melanoneura TaxID=428564 RepID=A0A8D8TGQ7_9HEMI
MTSSQCSTSTFSTRSWSTNVLVDNMIVSCKTNKAIFLQRVKNIVKKKNKSHASNEMSQTKSQQQMKGPEPKRIKLNTGVRGKTTDSNEDIRSNRQTTRLATE